MEEGNFFNPKVIDVNFFLNQKIHFQTWPTLPTKII